MFRKKRPDKLRMLLRSLVIRSTGLRGSVSLLQFSFFCFFPAPPRVSKYRSSLRRQEIA